MSLLLLALLLQLAPSNSQTTTQAFFDNTKVHRLTDEDQLPSFIYHKQTPINENTIQQNTQNDEQDDEFAKVRRRKVKATRTLKQTYMLLFCDISLACDQLKKEWDLMPPQAHVMMAYTNIDESPGQQMRFGIMSVPQVYLMVDGLFYEFPMDRLDPSNHKDVIAFTQKYEQMASNQGQIPVDVSSFTEKLMSMMATELEDSGGLFNILIMRGDDGEPNWRGIIILYVMPLFTCVSLCFIKLCKKRIPRINHISNELEDEILAEEQKEQLTTAAVEEKKKDQ